MELAEIAELLEIEAHHASLAAAHAETTGALIRLSDAATAFEVARWQNRARRMHDAAQTIRQLAA